MKTSVVCFALSAFAVGAYGAFPPPDAMRIAELEAALRDGTGVFTSCRGIGPLDAAEQDRVEALCRSAAPDFPRECYLEFYSNGVRTRYEQWRRARMAEILLLARAVRQWESARPLSALCERLKAVCTWPSWVLPAHDANKRVYSGASLLVDLAAAQQARELAEVICELKDALPSDVSERVRSEIMRRVLNPYLAVAAVRETSAPNWTAGNWWFSCGNNWNAVCHSECVRAAFAIVSEKSLRARIVEAAERALDAYFCGFSDDGYCSEGMGYWNYGYGNFLEMGLAVRSATGGRVDFFKHPRALAAMRFPLAFRMDGKLSPYFSDGVGCPDPQFIALGCRVWPELACEVRGDLPEWSEFPRGEVWISRIRCGGKILSFAVKGGNNGENHNHNDVGSWMLAFDGEHVAGDPGGEVYTARTFSRHRYDSPMINSFGHPVPRVAARLQETGSRASARDVSVVHGRDRDVMRLDISAAYGGGRDVKVVRTMCLDRLAQTVAVCDHIESAEPIALDIPVITYRDFAMWPDGKGYELRLRNAVAVGVSLEATGGAWHVEDTLIENPKRSSPHRISLSFTEPVTSAVARAVFVLRQ